MIPACVGFGLVVFNNICWPTMDFPANSPTTEAPATEAPATEDSATEDSATRQDDILVFRVSLLRSVQARHAAAMTVPTRLFH
jgi:hypothetical protein